jgi:hypothetical protein
MSHSLRIARSAADAAFESNRITRDLFNAENLPWIAVDIPQTVKPLYAVLTSDNKGGMTTTVSITVRNVGKTPAFQVTSGFPRYNDSLLPQEIMTNTRKIGRRHHEYKRQIIFPGNLHVFEHTFVVTEEQIEATWNAIGSPHFKQFAVCVVYKSGISDLVSETSFLVAINPMQPIPRYGNSNNNALYPVTLAKVSYGTTVT